MRLRIAAAAALVVLGPNAALAAGSSGSDQPPLPSAPSASVYSGGCLSPALNAPKKASDDESAFVTALLGAVVPGLIDRGLDFVGNALTRLAEDERTVLVGTRASEAAFSNRYCVQLAHWKAPDAKAKVQPKTLDELTKAAQWPELSDEVYVPGDRPLDFFVEFWVRPSKNGAALSFTPTLLYYPDQLGKGRNGADPAVVVKATLKPVGTDGASTSWALPKDLKPGAGLRELIPRREGSNAGFRRSVNDLSVKCEQVCDGASQWLANPWATEVAAQQKSAGGASAFLAPSAGQASVLAAAQLNSAVKPPGGPKPPAAAPAPQAAGPIPKAPADAAKIIGVVYATRPVNVELQVTEVRPGSKFFKIAADLFTAARPTVEDQLKLALLAAERDKAETKAQTDQATALGTFSTKIREAEVARRAYCAAKDVKDTNWLSVSSDLNAKEISANLAAAAAGQPAPYVSLVAIKASFDEASCSGD